MPVQLCWQKAVMYYYHTPNALNVFRLNSICSMSIFSCLVYLSGQSSENALRNKNSVAQ